MNKQTRYSPEFRKRAAMGSIASKIDCAAETLRQWVRPSERDQDYAVALFCLSAPPSRAVTDLTIRYAGRCFL